MGNVLTKSPQEFAFATVRSIEKQRQLIIEPSSPPAPPGYVRVHFYSHLYKICDRAPPDMAADIPLCRSGGLDMDVVRRRWGLDTCLPVDPLRWKPFQPTHPEYLSAVAIQVLSEGEDCLKFIEPTVSTQTFVQRQTRQVVLGIVTLLRLTCLRVIGMFVQCLEADTPLPSMCRRARQSLRRRAPRIKMGWDDLLNFMIVCCWLFLVLLVVVGSLGGCFQIAPRERARNWARTGSLSLQ